MRIGRSLPPAAAPISLKDICCGFAGICKGRPEIDRFEKELKEYFKMKHCFLVSSGKAALTIIFHALKEMFPGRDEVLIPAFTCYSVPSAIVRAGLKVRLCDVDSITFDFDYEQFSRIITQESDRLLCVVPVHQFGLPADMERLRSIVTDTDVIVVEDAAQAMGGEYKGKRLGSLGDVGLFSLGRGKALSTVEGGIILTERADIAAYLGRTVNEIPRYNAFECMNLVLYAVILLFLTRPSLFWLPKALPFLRLGETIYDPNFNMRRMSPFQAGLARGWEKKLGKLRKIRAENARALLERLKAIDIRPSWADLCALPGLLRFPLSIESTDLRGSILLRSEQLGLGIARTYPDSVDGIEALRSGYSGQLFPVAKEYAQKMITLPVHPYLTAKDLNNISNLLRFGK